MWCLSQWKNSGVRGRDFFLFFIFCEASIPNVLSAPRGSPQASVLFSTLTSSLIRLASCRLRTQLAFRRKKLLNKERIGSTKAAELSQEQTAVLVVLFCEPMTAIIHRLKPLHHHDFWAKKKKKKTQMHLKVMAYWLTTLSEKRREFKHLPRNAFQSWDLVSLAALVQV